MTQDTAQQKRMQRIAAIVEQLESAADPNARALAKELLENEIVEGRRVYELVGRPPAEELIDPVVVPNPQEGVITGPA